MDDSIGYRDIDVTVDVRLSHRFEIIVISRLGESTVLVVPDLVETSASSSVDIPENLSALNIYRYRELA